MLMMKLMLKTNLKPEPKLKRETDLTPNLDQKLKPEKTVKFRLQRDLSILSNWKEKHTPSRSLLPQ